MSDDTGSKAERTLQKTTTDMSFIINNNSGNARTAQRIQERNANNRRNSQSPLKAMSHHGAFNDSNELLFPIKASAAVRRAQNFQASLSDSLSFLQTQEIALEHLQKLIEDNSKNPVNSSHHDFEELFQAIADETFNGLELFSHQNEDHAFYLESSESNDSITINRPCLPSPKQSGFYLIESESPAELHMVLKKVTEALIENKKEQAKLQELSANKSLLAGNLDVEKIQNPQIAERAISLSKSDIFADARIALPIQANAAHAAVLRLFN